MNDRRTERLHTVYLALGTNLGHRRENLNQAIGKIKELIGDVVRQSAFIETEPWGFTSNNKFMNGCVRVLTDLTPRQVLEMTQAIESDMGRKEKSVNGVYHDRIIDIDILLYDDAHVDEPGLVIPHPKMHERDFVMIPLNEIMD